MSRVALVFFLLLLKHVNSVPQTDPNTNEIHVSLRPPTITAPLQPPLPIPSIPPREAKPLPFYSTTQQPFAKPLPFYSTTQQPFAKPLPYYNASTRVAPIAKPLPFYNASTTLIFHDDHNSLQNRVRRSIQSQTGINNVKNNKKPNANAVVPTPVAFMARPRLPTTESFRDIVQVF